MSLRAGPTPTPAWKRATDVVLAAALLGLLAPVFAAVAVAVGLSMGRPLLFRQRRAGRGNAPFTLLKFRTMRQNARNFGDDAARRTPVGDFLRRFSLDELPQLWNVLRGDMSLVGPRPLLLEYAELYTPRQARRLDVLPGVTGWSQVNGRNTVDWDERLRMDAWYVDHVSPWLDLRVLAMTAYKALLGRDDVPATLLPGSERFFEEPTAETKRQAA